MTTTEHAEQSAVIQYCALRGWRVFAIPNGAALKSGAMGWRRLEAEGAQPGVPDLFIPYARSGWHGLFIEMKRIGGQVSEMQKEWLDFLTEQGYLATVCYGADDAMDTINEYMSENIQGARA